MVLQDDFMNLHNIPPKSIYVSSGLAVEVKKYQKRFYLSFSKAEFEKERKKYINVPISEIPNVIKALRILEKHVKIHS